MMIRGIRSFDPGTDSILEFSTPLTLIVGANGTGKTTIIECLKYVATGNFPPNTRGGAFVYDPALNSDTETRAELRLRFLNGANEAIECFRSLQISNRGGRLVQKSLECTLSQVVSGTSKLLASKLGEIDKILPDHLGISSPLLDSVIFCHQEESAWPLGEPRVLKEKLDLILCSTKYNKAIKGLKDAKKVANSDIKLKEQEIEFLQREKTKRESLLSEITMFKEEEKSKKQKIQNMATDQEHLAATLNGLKEEMKMQAKIEQGFLVLRDEFEACKSFIKSFGHEVLREDELKIMYVKLEGAENPSGSERLLLSIKNLIEQRITDLESQMSQLDPDKTEQEFRLLSRLREEQSELFKNITAQEDRFMSYQQLVKEMTVDKSTLEGEIQKLLAKVEGGPINRTALENSGNYDENEIFRNAEAQVEKQRAALNDLNSRRFTHRSAIQRCETLQQDYKTEIGPEPLEPESEDDIAIDYDRMMEIESSLYGMTEKYSKIQCDLMNSDRNRENLYKKNCLEELLLNTREKLRAIDSVDLVEARRVKESQLAKAQSDKKLASELLTNFQSDSLQRQKELQNLKNELDFLFSDPAISVLPAFHAEYATEPATSGNSDDLLATEVLSEMQRLNKRGSWFQNSSEEAKIKIIKKFTTSQMAHLSSNIPVGIETVNVKPTEQYLNELTVIDSKIAATSSAIAIYRNFKKIGEQRNECPLCKKEMKPIELLGFVERLDRVIQKIPTELEILQQKKSDLRNTIAQIEQENSALESRRDTVAKITDITARMRRLIIEDIAHSVLLMTRVLSTDEFQASEQANPQQASELKIRQLEKEEVGLQTEMRLSEEAARRIESLQTEARSIEDQIQLLGPLSEDAENESLKATVERLRAELDARREEYNQQCALVREQTVKKQLREKQRQKRAMVVKLREVEQELEQLGRFDVGGLDEAIEAAGAELDKMAKTVMRQKVDLGMKIKRTQELTAGIAESNKNILQTQRALDTLQESPFDSQVTDAYKRASIPRDPSLPIEKCLDQLLAHSIESKNSYIRIISTLDKLKSKQQLVHQNIQLRDSKKKLLWIQKELNGFDFTILPKLKEKALSHESKLRELTTASAVLRGELNQLSQNILTLQQNISHHYADVVRNYAHSVIELKIQQLAVEDLDHSAYSLDRAIVDFHKAKMDEVNSTLRDLWSNTYKGNDIEYIELQSETTDSKAYNYSVLMAKNGTRLDMRGRCSAGQKMIASILIRLALADSFSEECNILALDEPTTNLDRPNIESLASTLVQLIKTRTNMQLIIISHDEDFIEILNREGIDSFYRLKRDSKGRSHIEKHFL